MLELYNFDSAVCAQKVRLVLSEKGIPWNNNYVNLTNDEQNDPAYLALNPNAVVPTLVHDDKVIIESTVINEYLDEVFPEAPLRPADAYGKALMRIWTKQIDDTVHQATTVVTFAIALRWRHLQRTPEQIEERIRNIPSLVNKRLIGNCIKLGVEAPEFPDAVLRFEKLIRNIDEALKDGRTWLLGNQITLADLNLLPYAYRLDHLELDAMFEPYPRFIQWYQRLRSRPSFSEALPKWDEDPDTPRFSENGKNAWPRVREILTCHRAESENLSGVKTR